MSEILRTVCELQMMRFTKEAIESIKKEKSGLVSFDVFVI